MTRQQALIIQALQDDVLAHRVYDRRKAIAKRKRNESIQDTATTIALVCSALLLTALTIALGIGLGLMFAGSF